MAVLIRKSLEVLDMVIFGNKLEEQNSVGLITDTGYHVIGHSSLADN